MTQIDKKSQNFIKIWPKTLLFRNIALIFSLEKPCYLENRVVREPCKQRTACIRAFSILSLAWIICLYRDFPGKCFWNVKSHLVTVCAGAGTPAAIAGFASVSPAAAAAPVALLSSELKGRRCRKLRRRVLQSKEKKTRETVMCFIF